MKSHFVDPPEQFFGTTVPSLLDPSGATRQFHDIRYLLLPGQVERTYKYTMFYLRRLQHFLCHNSAGTLGCCKSSFHGHDQPVNAPGRLSLCIFLQDIWIPHWLGGVANQKLKVALKPPLIAVHICCHESNTLEAGPSVHTRALTDLHSPVSVCTSDLKTGRCPSLASLPSRSVGSFWGPSGLRLCSILC